MAFSTLKNNYCSKLGNSVHDDRNIPSWNLTKKVHMQQSFLLFTTMPNAIYSHICTYLFIKKVYCMYVLYICMKLGSPETFIILLETIMVFSSSHFYRDTIGHNSDKLLPMPAPTINDHNLRWTFGNTAHVRFLFFDVVIVYINALHLLIYLVLTKI